MGFHRQCNDKLHSPILDDTQLPQIMELAEAAPQLHKYITFYVPKQFAAPIGVGPNLEPGTTAQNSRFRTTTPPFTYRSTAAVQRRTRSHKQLFTARGVDSPAHDLLNDHHTLGTVSTEAAATRRTPHTTSSQQKCHESLGMTGRTHPVLVDTTR